MYVFSFLIDVNECVEMGGPCRYLSTCTNLPGSYRCICPPGRTGKHCETGK